MKIPIKKMLPIWLPIAAVATILCLTIYAAVQQDLRLTANDPQIQLSEDIGSTFAQGQDPHQLSANNSIDISKSLSPFLVVYDDTGKEIISSGQLNGKSPSLPKGILDYAKAHGEDRFTWQPQKGVRIAAVVYYYHGTNTGYVLAGKNMREIEKRENLVLLFSAVAWLLSLIVSAALIWFFQREASHHQHTEHHSHTS